MSATNIRAQRALSSQTFTQGEGCPTRTGQLSACLFRHLGMRSLACGGHAHGVRRPGSEDTPAGSPADSPWSATVAFSDRRSDKTPVGEKPAVQKRSTRQIGARERSGFGHASPQNPVGEKSSVQKKHGRESDVCDVAHQRATRSAYGTGRPRATIPPARWARRPRDARLGCAS